MPFRVAGGVVKGTANVTKSAITAPGKARKKKKDKKAKEEDEKMKKEAKEKVRESQSSFPPLPPAPIDTLPIDELPSIDDDLPPLPSEYE